MNNSERPNLADRHLVKDPDGNWLLRLEKGGLGVKIPEKLALLVHEMLLWEDGRIDKDISENLRKINCHKTILYLTDLISRDEFLSDPRLNKDFDFTSKEKAQAISTKEFVSVKNETELRDLAL